MNLLQDKDYNAVLRLLEKTHIAVSLIMPVRTIQTGLLPEIDTTMEQDKGLLRQHPASSSSHGISFRDADTPKHCNKGEKGAL